MNTNSRANRRRSMRDPSEGPSRTGPSPSHMQHHPSHVADQFNDDENEKRNRRTSFRPSSENRRQSMGVASRALSAGTPARSSAASGPSGTSTDLPGVRGGNVPIMANFEELMKLIKDNKINASNSWNFQLIDYFHDMSVLKEGDGINFQKASYTLDGCVKIYTSRVDSVASATGMLLSGLSERKNGKRGLTDDAEDQNDEDNEDSDNAERRKLARRRKRGEATLAKDFDQIKAKKLELELAVDPLFRKIMTDCNEGGAHSLLLNSLSIDGTGRVVFDGQSDTNADSGQEVSLTAPPPDTQVPEKEDDDLQNNIIQIDLSLLQDRFFPDLEAIDEMTICPSLPRLEEIVKDPTSTVSIISDMETLMMEEAERRQKQRMQRSSMASTFSATQSSAAGFNDDDDDIVEGTDFMQAANNAAAGRSGEAGATDGDDYGFGGYGGDDDDYGYDGGDVGQYGLIDPAGESALEFGEPEVAKEPEAPENETINPDQTAGNITSIAAQAESKEGFSQMMAYFDENLRTNWAGPEHWKIQKVKTLVGISKPQAPAPASATTQGEEGDEDDDESTNVTSAGTAESATKKKQRRRKETTVIDMLNGEDVLDDDIFNSGDSRIYISKNNRNTSTNLLPEDMHFQSDDLIHLFYKPKATLFRTSKGGASLEKSNVDADGLARPDDHIDENFFANHLNEEGQTDIRPDFGDEAFPAFDNDGDYGNDDDNDYGGGDDDVFNNTLPDMATQADEFGASQGQMSGIGLDGVRVDLVGSTRARPEYVSYARAAKRVDLKRLKDNVWKILNLDEPVNERSESTENDGAPKKAAGEQEPQKEGQQPERLFSNMMGGLDTIYGGQQLRDISTSFCFISLLHLANEKGLVLESVADHTDISIKRDLTVRKDQLSA